MRTETIACAKRPDGSFSRRAVMALSGVLMLAGALLVGLAPAMAEPIAPPDAEAHIQNLGDRVVSIINDGGLSLEEKKSQMADIVREGVDIRQVGILSAGRAWRSADEAQRAEFLDLFEQYLVATYSRRLDEYSGTSFEVTGSQPVGKEDVMVVTRVQGPKSAPGDVGWRLRDRGQGPKIIDVDFGGVSMLKTQREEFAAVIERAGGKFDALIEAIQSKVQTPEAG